jgi:hypothetical protein
LKFITRGVLSVITSSVVYRCILVLIDWLAWINYPRIVFHHRRHLKFWLLTCFNCSFYFILTLYFIFTYPKKTNITYNFMNFYFYEKTCINTHLVFFHALASYILYLTYLVYKFLFLSEYNPIERYLE